MIRRTAPPVIVLAALALLGAPVLADDREPAATPPSPVAALPPPAAMPVGPTPRRAWRVVASAVFGVRGNQGGLHVAGLRLVWSAGLMTRSLDLLISLDRQISAGDRVLDSGGNPATWSEWVTSARVGRRFGLGPDLWVRATAGLSLVHSEVSGTLIDGTGTFEVGRSNLGLDAVAAIAWKSGPVATSLVAGMTAVPVSQELVVGGARFVLPPRLEPWVGLGAGLIF